MSLSNLSLLFRSAFRCFFYLVSLRFRPQPESSSLPSCAQARGTLEGLEATTPATSPSSVAASLPCPSSLLWLLSDIEPCPAHHNTSPDSGALDGHHPCRTAILPLQDGLLTPRPSTWRTGSHPIYLPILDSYSSRVSASPPRAQPLFHLPDGSGFLLLAIVCFPKANLGLNCYTCDK